MSVSESDLVEQMAKKYSVSPAAVTVVLAALRSSGCRMAQFSHADFGGMSQWSPGMTVIGDMFNAQLKTKLDALCSDLAAHLEAFRATDGTRSVRDEVSFRSMSGSADWWPAGLGRPGAVGSQNDLRYAVFPDARRLVIDDHGSISIHDTGSHRIFGVAGAEQRADPYIHKPGRAGQGDGTAEGCRVTARPVPRHATTRPFSNLIPAGPEPTLTLFRLHGGCGGV